MEKMSVPEGVVWFKVKPEWDWLPLEDDLDKSVEAAAESLEEWTSDSLTKTLDEFEAEFDAIAGDGPFNANHCGPENPEAEKIDWHRVAEIRQSMPDHHTEILRRILALLDDGTTIFADLPKAVEKLIVERDEARNGEYDALPTLKGGAEADMRRAQDALEYAKTLLENG